MKDRIKKLFSEKKDFIHPSSILLIWFFIIFFFIKNNIGNSSFWFDESGQFWIAKGLNHYSQSFSVAGNLWQVLSNNIKFNLDPGGFSIILHFWTMLSNNLLFLRILPLSFFILAIILVSKLCIIWKPKNYLAYLGGFILLLSPILNYYAFELRPYSMEILATILSIYFCYKIKDILNDYKYASFSGILLAFLLTSRYSVLFSIISLTIIIFYTLIFKSFKKKNIINFIIFILPIIISCFLIYEFTLQYQNPTGIPPSYVNELMFKTWPVSDVLFNKLIDKTTLKVLFPFLSLILLYLISFKNNYLKNILKTYNLFFYYSLILNLIFIILSFLGKYPWAINSRWNISIHSLFIISWLPLIFILMDFLSVKKNFLFKSFRIIILAIFIIYSFDKAYTFRYITSDLIYLNYTKNNVSPDSKILINTEASPTLRYLFEYGSLKNFKNSYTYKNFSMFNDTDSDSIKNFDKVDNYDYIILTGLDYSKSNIKNILDQKPNWIDATVGEKSKLLKNINTVK